MRSVSIDLRNNWYEEWKQKYNDKLKVREQLYIKKNIPGKETLFIGSTSTILFASYIGAELIDQLAYMDTPNHIGSFSPQILEFGIMHFPLTSCSFVIGGYLFQHQYRYYKLTGAIKDKKTVDQVCEFDNIDD